MLPAVLLLATVGTAMGTTMGSSSVQAQHGATPLNAPAVTRPNVLVVMTDDMRHDDVRFMPNVIRHLRDRGVDWRNSFAPTPLCCPNRASFLTGKYTHNHRVMSHEQPWGYQAFDDSVTIAGALRAAGYRTGYIGKYLNGYGEQAPRAAPRRRHSYTYVPSGWSEWRASPDETPFRESDPRTGGTYRFFDTTLNVNGRLVGHPGTYASAVLADHARRVLDRFSSGPAPWFLMLNPVAPHEGAPKERDDTWIDTPARPGWVKGRFDEVIQRAPGVPANGVTEADVSDKVVVTRRRPELSARRQRALRGAARQRAEALFALDVQLGRVFRKLRETGEYADTILVLTSDNGFMMGEHRWPFGKVIGYEPSYRVPMIMAGPRLPRGIRRFSPITTIDLSATILDWADATLPGVDGHSVVPEIHHPAGWDRIIGYESHMASIGRIDGLPGFTDDARTAIGVRTARYSYVAYGNREVEMFDLLLDPNQLRSVAADPDYRMARRQLRAAWEVFRQCREAKCAALLPLGLRRSPEQTRQLRRVMERENRRYYAG